MKRILLSTTVFVLAAVPALAGNLDPAPAPAPVVAPVPVPPAPVGGDWGGPYAGAQLGYGFGDVGGTDFEGVIGGVYGGYNYDFGQFVLGGEADISIADLQLDGAGDDAIDTVARLKARAGLDAGRALFYGTAGAAYANADIGGASLNDFGWLVGAGVDYQINDRWTAGVEYLYHQFDDFDNSGADVEVNTISARVGLSF